MKSTILFLAMLPLWLPAIPSNPSFYLKLDDALVTNAGTKLEVAIYIAGSSTFNLGSCNLEFLFDSSLIESPTLLSHTLDLANYLTPTVTCPTEDKTALNIVLDNINMGDAIAAYPSWTKLATLEFDIKASGDPLDLCWSYDGGTKETVAFLDDETTQIYVASPETDLGGVAQMFLPVELVDFSAQWANDKQTQVLLSWTTLSENNSDVFEVQRSDDARNWTSVAEVLAQGFSTASTDYQWKDILADNYSVEQVYYRLKQLDFDGTAKFSHIEILNREASNLDINIYPTIFQNELHVALNEDGFLESEIELSLLNIEGKLLFSMKETASKQITINDLDYLPKGFYFLKMKSDNQSFTQKVLKL